MSRSTMIAAFAAAAVSAEFVGGKATRDALFLTSFDITALPTMLMATSVASIALSAMYGRGAQRLAPAVLVPTASFVSGLLFLVEWWSLPIAPRLAAVALYLHVSAVVPILASGFWLISTERFDPRAAKRLFGRIAASGTLGGLVGAVTAERLAAQADLPTMLICLSMFQFIASGLIRALAVSDSVSRPTHSSHGDDRASISSSLTVLRQAPHLRQLMMLVVLGTVAAALLDYLFKARAVDTFGRGESLLRFFSMYYAATSLVAFGLQTFGSRAVLERFGLGLATASPSIALLAGTFASIIAPGLGGIVVARGTEAAFRGSWFRSGYELFYTPLPSRERRAAKSLIDVALDRISDALGGGFVRVITTLMPAAQSSALMFGSLACSAGAILAASRLNRWYVRTLENSLVIQGADLGSSDTKDGATTRMLQDVRQRRNADPATSATTRPAKGAPSETDTVTAALDPVLRDMAILRKGDEAAIMRLLSKSDGLARPLVSEVIPLLASDTLGDYAMFALRKIAEEHVGQLTDALVDPNQPVTVRRRLARVFSIGVSQRAAEALLLALDDARFDVRFQAVRSLAQIQDKNPGISIERSRIERVVLAEIEAARPIWESHRQLEAAGPGYLLDDGNPSPLDSFIHERASRSLSHVFALLSLVLPREPLQIALRSLNAEDHHLRGTALEYLEGVLPHHIRQALSPFLVRQRRQLPVEPRDAIVARLLRAQPTATLLGLAASASAAAIAGSSVV